MPLFRFRGVAVVVNALAVVAEVFGISVRRDGSDCLRLPPTAVALPLAPAGDPTSSIITSPSVSSIKPSKSAISSSCSPPTLILPSSFNPLILPLLPAHPPSPLACLANASPRANLRPHLVQTCGRSPVCSFEWRFRSWRRRKRAWQVVHRYGFS